MDIFNNIYDGKTILVTGDTCFKGSWLVIWLLNLGANVIGYALPPKNENDNFLACGLDKRIKHINGDTRNYEALLGVFAEFSPAIVFHLAAQPLVLDSYKDPLYTYGTNIMGTVNMFEAVRHTPSIKAVVNVTSDKCYENREWTYGYREIDTLGGKDPYSASKGAAEVITHSYLQSFFNRDDTANIVSARAGNVIGGGDWSENRIFPDCMRALLYDRQMILRSPEAVRPWQHVLEPLSGYLTLGSLLYTEGKKYTGAWNFGPLSQNMVSVRQLVSETIRQWGSSKVIDEDERYSYAEAGLLHLDINKAINKLNWRPVLDFRQAIEFAIAEYRVDGFSIEEVYNQRSYHIEQYTEMRRRINA